MLPGRHLYAACAVILVPYEVCCNASVDVPTS